MCFFFFLITVTTHFKNVAARMSEAAAQRGFWRTRVDASRIERQERKKKSRKKDCTVIESRDFFYVNCQQHKYFVLLFVPFCKKTTGKKEEKKGGEECVVSDVCL